MPSIVSPVLNGLAPWATAGDTYLAQYLSPTHLDPVVAADPLRSTFLIADSDGGERGGPLARERWLEDLTSKTLEPARTYARVYELIQAWTGPEGHAELESIGRSAAVEALVWLAKEPKDVAFRLNAVSALCALDAVDEASLLIPEIVEMVFLADFRSRPDKRLFWEAWGLIPFQGIIGHPQAGPILPQIYFLMAGAVIMDQGKTALIRRLSSLSAGLGELRLAAVQALGEIVRLNLSRFPVRSVGGNVTRWPLVDLKNWIRGGLPSFKNSPKKNMPSEEIGREEGFYRATEDWDLPETVRNRAFSGLFCLHPISLERLLPVLVGRELRRIVLNLEGSGRYQFLRDVLRLVPFDSLLEESLNEESDVSLTEVIHTMSCLWLIGCGLDDLWDDGPVGREAGQRMWKHLQAARVAALEEGLLKGVVTMRILRDAGTERERRATEPIWRAIQKTIGED